MKRERRWAKIALLSLLAGPLAAQEGVLRFDRLSVEDGLSHSTVRSIHQDARGFLWFGTQEGLNRYDGYQFSVYKHDPADPGSLAESEIMAVYGDRRGELWVGTWGGGLHRLAPGATGFVHYRHDPNDPASLRHDVVTALLESRSGALWIGTQEGLDRLDGGPPKRTVPGRGSETFSRVDPRPGDLETGRVLSVKKLAEDAAGGLWVATSEGLFRLDQESEILDRFVAEACPGGTVGALAADPDGTLWAAAGGALLRLDRRDGSCKVYRHDPADPRSLGEATILSLHVDRDGELWVGTETQGLGRFDRVTESFTHSRHQALDPDSLSDNSVLDIYQDRTGILWLGSFVGINKYDRSRERFVTYRQRAGRGLASNSIWAIHEDLGGALWVGHYDRGLDRIDRAVPGRRGSVVHYPPAPDDPTGLPHGTVSAIAEDPSGDLWIGTWGGLARLERRADGSERFRTYRHDPADPESLSDDGISTLLLDSRRRLWVGTYSGLDRVAGDRVAGDGRFIHYPAAPGDPESLGETPIYAIHEGRDALWFGSDRDGLYRLDPETPEGGPGGFTHYRHDPNRRNSLSSDKIAALHEDASGFLWVGTYSAGLNRLDRAVPGRERRRFVHYREKDGLPNDTILGILEDDAGRLWLSTNDGLSRFDPRAETFRNYDVDDGLQGIVFSSGSAFESAGGEMFFGGINGFNAFFPERIAEDSQPPQVAVTDLLLSTREAPLQPARSAIRDGELVLSHQQYAFAVEFAALHYASPRKNRYAYRLEGFDRDWIATGADKRFAQYSNLDPGDYLLRVKGSNGDGVWNEEGVAVRITVLPPPWKTWWAYGLYALGLVAAVAGYTGLQRRKVERERAINRRLREVDRLKDQFLANTSHELRTPLFGMVGITESLLDGASGSLSAATRSDLEMVAASGRRLQRLVDDILDFSKLSRMSLELQLRPVDLYAATDVVLALSKPLADDKSLALRNAVGRDLPPAWADENRLQQILHNLVGNAIKFTASGSIEVTAVAEEGRIAVRVADTGIGIAEGETERIFEVFEQADGTAERAYGGTGLGLAVTRQLVELHGGSIWVDSTPGQGSTFTFVLPLAAEGTGPAAAAARPPGAKIPAAPTPAPAAETPVEGPPPLRERAAPREVAPAAAPGPAEVGGAPAPSRILIVDDEPVIRRVLAGQLAAQGYALTVASSGEEALDLLGREPFDLVLLDVMMPRMSGLEVCRTLRRRHRRDELPVVFLTAKTRVSDRVTGFAAGASDYLTKPIEKEELLARVRTHLELLAANRSMARLVGELRAQAARLETKNAELERFTYTVSHDLKNPVVTIKSYLGLLQRDADRGDPEAMRRDVGRIHAAAEKMYELLNDLVELSRIGRLRNPPEEVPAAELAREACELLAAPIAETGTEVVIASDLPVVYGDRQRLQEVFQNLIDNAVKYAGGETAPRVEIASRQEEGREVLFVRDNGPGVDPRYQEKIFGLFERLDPAIEGTGVGLTLVKRIVEAHGGRIWVESAGAGAGSTFCFTLPRAPAPGPDGPREPIEAAAIGGRLPR